MPKSRLPKIAIVGRPNVGKSSLFNRIIGSRKAIIEPASGTTRDRLYSDVRWKGRAFTIVDTGGFDDAGRGDISRLILKQLSGAIDEADIIIFVTDALSGVLPQDRELALKLRKTAKKIFLVVNKIDDKSRAAHTAEFFELGLGEPYAVSAVNGIGIDRLLDDASRDIEISELLHGKAAIKVAIVGRPNVGKSSYLNAITKEDRAIVHHVAGTTRDALDTDFNYKGRDYRLIDTAGMRHNARPGTSADFYGSVRAREAIKRSDVAIAMIDGQDGLREDDIRVIDFCIAGGKALIVAVNKWDLVKGTEMTAYKEMLIKKMRAIRNFPVIFISAKSGRNVTESLDLIAPAYERVGKVFSQEELSKAMELLKNSPEIRNRRVVLWYLKASHANPPTFIIGVKSMEPVTRNLERYTENFLRSAMDLEGVPVKVVFEKGAVVRKKRR